ncbi:DUF6053 domain-containing protein [Marinobacter aromaticivorans]|uniref:DUF6053 domain-containing protein n=1 Tax=Marinobacter aromaticivorans TaxID=1494078 RepID=A0ABW2ISY1_9GAMM
MDRSIGAEGPPTTASMDARDWLSI